MGGVVAIIKAFDTQAQATWHLFNTISLKATKAFCTILVGVAITGAFWHIYTTMRPKTAVQLRQALTSRVVAVVHHGINLSSMASRNCFIPTSLFALQPRSTVTITITITLAFGHILSAMPPESYKLFGARVLMSETLALRLLRKL